MNHSGRKIYTLNCKGRLLVIDRPLVMGILNITPDSFYAKSRIPAPGILLEEVGKMLAAGAAILDIGGMSTRPGTIEISEEEEADRVLSAIELIRKEFKEVFISIDTYRSKVATAAIAIGADIVNDISAGDLDPEMLPAIARLQVPYIAMHMKGTPGTMQVAPEYENVVSEVMDYFICKKAMMAEAGIKDIIIDPGFGFGKDMKHNYALLKSLHSFSMLDAPLLVGVSRKSMINKLLHITADEALNGTTILNTLALQQGASILRVHDVKEAMQAVAILDYMDNI